jgi:hypothetical protein
MVKEVEKMEPALVEGLSLPQNQFFCYKNFMTGLVRVKVNNFDSILQTNHVYPIRNLKLVLKLNGSSLNLFGEKENSKTALGIFTLENVAFKA